MRLKKYLIALIVGSVTAFFASVSFANAIQTIHFATEATYPPFEYVNASGKIEGFDIDVANALCQQLHATCTFSNQPFASLIPSLNLGKFDALIAALGMTATRAKEVAFTNSYYEPSAYFVGLTEKHYALAHLDGKTIGTQMGSTFQPYLEAVYGNKITVKLYASMQEAYLDLAAGRIDAVIADTPIALSWLKKDNHAKQYSVIGHPITNHQYFGDGYGIAVRQNNKVLLTALNQALSSIKANGTYQMLINKYFHS